MIVKGKKQVTWAQNKCLKPALFVWLKNNVACNTVDTLSVGSEKTMDTESPTPP